MASLVNNCVFTVASSGTGNFVASAAVTGYQMPVAVGVADGKTYRYRAQSLDLSEWEEGSTVASSTATGFTRVVTASSAGGTTKTNFTAAPTVALTMFAEDVLQFDDAMSLTSTQKNQARTNLGVPGENIIINGDFRVNQRVYVSAAALAAGVYGHDRWKAGASGGNYSFTQLASSTQITIAASKTLIQVVEDKNVVGGSYVLSWAGTCQARVGLNSATPSGAFANSPILITGQTAGTTMSVEFGNGASSGTLGTVKLEPGSVATPFSMPPWNDELTKCQRYFEKSYNYSTAPGAAVGAGTNGLLFSNAGGVVGSIVFSPYKVRKRAAPTLTSYDGVGSVGKFSWFNGVWNNGGTVTPAGSNTEYVYNQNLGTGLSGSVAYLGVDFTAEAEL